jgi:hypothetical protein
MLQVDISSSSESNGMLITIIIIIVIIITIIITIIIISIIIILTIIITVMHLAVDFSSGQYPRSQSSHDGHYGHSSLQVYHSITLNE